jgi:hypothetical protein
MSEGVGTSSRASFWKSLSRGADFRLLRPDQRPVGLWLIPINPLIGGNKKSFHEVMRFTLLDWDFSYPPAAKVHDKFNLTKGYNAVIRQIQKSEKGYRREIIG